MNTTAKAPKSASKPTNSTLPTAAQIIALALEKAEHQLDQLREIRRADEHWDEDDVDVDYAVDLSLSHIRRMKERSFVGSKDFDREWFAAASAINLAVKSFSRTDCYYSRSLLSVKAMFDEFVLILWFTENTLDEQAAA